MQYVGTQLFAECRDWPARSPSPTRQCTICSAPSNGYHFNAPSCSACAAFFRRTVTLGRQFLCAHQGNCKVHFEMRIICRACRYAKCIQMGMERQAVQPRRDGNVGRRKISYLKRPPSPKQWSSGGTGFHVCKSPRTSIAFLDSSALSPDTPSYSSSVSDEHDSVPHSLGSLRESGEDVLEMLLREERLYNERRSILYCVRSRISEILSAGEVDDIPFSSKDLNELTFAGVRKDIRAQILATYEWMRGWNHFKCLSTSDKKTLLRRCTLFHPIIDPCYLTMRLGLPDRFVMFNGMFIAIDSEEGWRDETCISASLKKEVGYVNVVTILGVSELGKGFGYRPPSGPASSPTVVASSDARPLTSPTCRSTVNCSKAAGHCSRATLSATISSSLKRCLTSQIDLIFTALSNHYASLGMSAEDVAVRTGNVILLIGNIFEVGMQCLESHQVIQFFDLWKLDDLLIKLISESLQS
ncbi:zinc finger, C4 type [Cooperia oncophora]